MHPVLREFNFQEDASVFLSKQSSCGSPDSGKMLTCPVPAEGAARADTQRAICVLLLKHNFSKNGFARSCLQNCQLFHAFFVLSNVV